MQTTYATNSEALDLTADYLRREMRENAIEQGYDDPFPDEEPLEASEGPDRLKWLSAITIREKDRFTGKYDGSEDEYRLVEKFGREFVEYISHITPVGGYKDKAGYWHFAPVKGLKMFNALVDKSEMWGTACRAVRNWLDVIDYELTPKHKALWVYLKLDILGRDKENVSYVMPGVKAIRVCVHGDIVDYVKRFEY